MGFFRKIFCKIRGNNENSRQNPGLLEYSDRLKNADLDYKFAQLFTLSGGIFNYCANETEAINVLRKIIKTEKINSCFCYDEDLIKFLDVIKCPYTQTLQARNQATFITCEYLIAFDARIMLSHNNILHYNSSRLPKKIIVIANVSQIVPNLNSAMMKIKKQQNIRNLTSISGKETRLEEESRSDTKLFLLLLED